MIVALIVNTVTELSIPGFPDNFISVTISTCQIGELDGLMNKNRNCSNGRRKITILQRFNGLPSTSFAIAIVSETIFQFPGYLHKNSIDSVSCQITVDLGTIDIDIRLNQWIWSLRKKVQSLFSKYGHVGAIVGDKELF